MWSRQHYRGSYAADLWVANLANNTYTKLLADERYNRYWPMWGADDSIYFVADPLPNDRSVKPGSFEVRKSLNNIYKIPAKGGQPVQVTKHTDGNVFWPSMSSDGKVIVYEDNFGIWRLDLASGRSSDNDKPVKDGAHIRAMDAPSLRQFQLDLAANRTKRALVIDQRFNGGGGIDQELLGILAGRQYQYTVGRDAGFQQPRPQNFYGPMVASP